MFTDLASRIDAENLGKVKREAKRRRYQNEQSQRADDLAYDEDSSLDDLQVKYQQRAQNFHRNLESETAYEEEAVFLKRDSSTPPSLLRKMQNQIALLQQKIKLERASHERDLSYIQELHKRREEWAQTELSRLKAEVKKYKGADLELKNARKSLAEADEIRDKMNEEINQLHLSLRQLKKQNQDLARKVQSLNQQQAKQLTGDKDKWSQKLKLTIKQLQNQLASQRKGHEEKRLTINRLNNTIRTLQLKINTKQREMQNLSIEREQKSEKAYEELSEQIAVLKRRNQYLESTFLQKVSQITKIQAHLISSSFINQPNVSPGVLKPGKQESSLNLQQDQSPIKFKPGQYSSKKNKGRKNYTNPEIKKHEQQASNKISHQGSEKCVACDEKIGKYESALRKANQKLMSLLEEKISNVSALANTTLKRPRIMSQLY